MNNMNTPPKHLNAEFIPPDASKDARNFLDLDKTRPVASSLQEQKEFISGFEQSAGLRNSVDSIVFNSISSRAQLRSEQASDRRPMNTGKKVALGAGVAAAAMVYGLIGGQDMEHERDLAEYDQKNQEENIANNPELFGQDLPQDPTETTVTVEQ